MLFVGSIQLFTFRVKEEIANVSVGFLNSVRQKKKNLTSGNNFGVFFFFEVYWRLANNWLVLYRHTLIGRWITTLQSSPSVKLTNAEINALYVAW